MCVYSGVDGRSLRKTASGLWGGLAFSIYLARKHFCAGPLARSIGSRLGPDYSVFSLVVSTGLFGVFKNVDQ